MIAAALLSTLGAIVLGLAVTRRPDKLAGDWPAALHGDQPALPDDVKSFHAVETAR